MNISELIPTVEAVIFACGASVPIERLALALDTDKNEIIKAIDILTKKYSDSSSGISIIRLGDNVQMTSKAVYAQAVRKVMDLKKNTPLSNAAFEVLAVVAYNQPVTKAFIEQVRGVDCSGVVSSLCQKDLIEEKGRLELPGRPLIYGTTENFLRCFSISSLSELPLPQSDSQNESDNESADSDEKSAMNSTDNNRDTENSIIPGDDL